MAKFLRSWSLVKSSFRLLRHDRKLLVLPLVSLITIGLSGAAWLVTVWSVHPLVQTRTVFDGFGMKEKTGLSLTPLTIAMLAFGFAVLTFVSMFFNAALIYGANQRLSGQEPTLRSSLRGAGKHVGPIALWALFSATIVVVARGAAQRAGLLGRIVISIVGTLWAVATFFVLPILIIEGASVNEAFDRSKSMVRRTWGEQVIGNAAISYLFGPVMLITMIIVGLGAIFVSYWLLLLLPFVLLAVITLSNAVSVVFSTVLYHFANSGFVPAGQLLYDSYKPKPAKKK
jgi:Family of unknown function (DUF6159)